ncbi:MAG: AMP-binding protein [Deltaproteobacteria bacterium]|nr:AMP-binding protein [Deltaproteobacteria bacterium]
MSSFNNLVEMQEHSCRVFAERPMYGVKREGRLTWTTFGEFGAAVDELRGGLSGLGLGPGDKVAIIANNCLEWPVAAYATYGLGAHFVPMYESQPLEDWEYIIRDSGAKALLVRTPELLDRVRHLRATAPHLASLVLLQGRDAEFPSYASLRAAGRDAPRPSLSPAATEPFGLIYTSGTTGAPKGVILTHGNLMAELASVADILEFTPADVSLSFLPWGHLMGQIEEVHFLILKGFSATLVADVNEIMADFAAVRPTIFFTVPKLYQRFYQAVDEKLRAKGGLARQLFTRGSRVSARARRGEPLGPLERLSLAAARALVFNKIKPLLGGRLRMSMCGGAALNPEVIGFLEDLGVTVYEGYGLTETTMAVSANSLAGRRQGSVGRALEGARLSLDPAVEGAAPGEGEIIVHGPHVAVGYHNQPEVYAACLTEDGGFRTGDLGRFDDEGFLYITGRVKELYKLANGKYVAPAPLEEALRQSPLINHVMLHGDNQDYNVALIVPEDAALAAVGGDDEREKMVTEEVARLAAGFKPFERPKKIALLSDQWTVENGLLTPTLKIKRAVIRRKYQPVLERLFEA